MNSPQDPFMQTMTQIPVINTEPQKRPDGPVLHFLKELPSPYILSVLIIFFAVFFYLTQADYMPRIIDSLVAATLTALVVQRKPATATVSGPTNVDIENAEIESKQASVKIDKLGG